MIGGSIFHPKERLKEEVKDMLARYKKANEKRLHYIKVLDQKYGGKHTFEDGTTLTSELLRKYYRENLELQEQYITKLNPGYV